MVMLFLCSFLLFLQGMSQEPCAGIWLGTCMNGDEKDEETMVFVGFTAAMVFLWSAGAVLFHGHVISYKQTEEGSNRK